MSSRITRLDISEAIKLDEVGDPDSRCRDRIAPARKREAGVTGCGVQLEAPGSDAGHEPRLQIESDVMLLLAYS